MGLYHVFDHILKKWQELCIRTTGIVELVFQMHSSPLFKTVGVACVLAMECNNLLMLTCPTKSWLWLGEHPLPPVHQQGPSMQPLLSSHLLPFVSLWSLWQILVPCTQIVQLCFWIWWEWLLCLLWWAIEQELQSFAWPLPRTFSSPCHYSQSTWCCWDFWCLNICLRSLLFFFTKWLIVLGLFTCIHLFVCLWRLLARHWRTFTMKLVCPLIWSRIRVDGQCVSLEWQLKMFQKPSTCIVWDTNLKEPTTKMIDILRVVFVLPSV